MSDSEEEIFQFDSISQKDHSEYKIHVAISDYLNGQIRKGNKVYPTNPPFHGMLVTHAYQGRSKEEGFFLKALGVKPGIGDLLCWYSHPKKSALEELSKKYNIGIPLYECSFLEVKTKDGIQSSPQRKIMGWCHALGIPYAIVRSVRDAHNHFINRGLKAHTSAIKEPDTRSEAQKKQAIFDLYMPRKD